MCSREGLLDFENEAYVVFYLLSGRGPASSIVLLLWSFCPQGRKCSAWGPSVSCLSMKLRPHRQLCVCSDCSPSGRVLLYEVSDGRGLRKKVRPWAVERGGLVQRKGQASQCRLRKTHNVRAVS